MQSAASKIALLILLTACTPKGDDDDTGNTDTADTTTQGVTPTGACVGVTERFADTDEVLFKVGEESWGVFTLALAPDGCLWASTLGASRFNGTEAELFDSTNSPIGDPKVRSVLFDGATVWTTTDVGEVAHFDPADGAGENHGAVGSFISFFDNNGVLWGSSNNVYGTFSTGITAYDPHSDTASTITPQDLGVDGVMLIDMAPDGRTLWMLGYAFGPSYFIEYDTIDRSYTSHPIAAEGIDGVTGVVDSDGVLWAFYREWRFKVDSTGVLVEAADAVGAAFGARRSDGSVGWISVAYTGNGSEVITQTMSVDDSGISLGEVLYTGDNLDLPYSFAYDADDNIWLGTSDQYLRGFKR